MLDEPAGAGGPVLLRSQNEYRTATGRRCTSRVRLARVYALAVALVLCGLILHYPGMTRVTPLEAESSGDSAVSHNAVSAVGKAQIHGGDINSARKTALAAAYAEAVALGTGIAVESLTMIRDVSQISDVVTARSRGVVQRYEIVSEEIVSNGEMHELQIVIDAQVTEQAATEEDSLEALRLFLQVLGRPRIMILLPAYDATHEGRESSSAQLPDGVLRGIEAAVAHQLNQYGYRTVTPDMIGTEVGRNGAELLKSARAGNSLAAMEVARRLGVAALIVGHLAIATQEIDIEGVSFAQAAGEFSARVYIVSTKEEVRTFYSSSTKAHTNVLAAVSAVKRQVAKEIAEELAWSIPNVLSDSPHIMQIRAGGVDVGTADRIAKALRKLEGVLDSRLVALPDRDGNPALIQLTTGYIQVPPQELLWFIEDSVSRGFEVASSSAYELVLQSTGDRTP